MRQYIIDIGVTFGVKIDVVKVSLTANFIVFYHFALHLEKLFSTIYMRFLIDRVAG